MRLTLILWTLLVMVVAASPITRSARPAPAKRADKEIPEVTQVVPSGSVSSKSSESESGSASIPVVSEFHSSDSASKAESTSGSDTKSDSKDDSKSDSKSNTDKNSKSDDSSKSGSDKSKSDDSTKKDSKTEATSTSISIDPRLGAGGIEMLTPASTESTYIKIGDYATFKWNYTSLSVTPSYVNILAVCTSNSQTITIATKHPAKETEILWDTSLADKNSSLQLLTSTYTLEIYDPSGNKTASSVASAGYLGPFTYTFGMYRPQSYTPWGGDSSYMNIASLVDVTSLKWVLTMGLIFVGSALQIILT
uniref:ARAD1D41690p n=1 Tax=Blastobotrys adeninivorans TaxID=409370 RepID=A0A060TCF7_BLAAD